MCTKWRDNILQNGICAYVGLAFVFMLLNIAASPYKSTSEYYQNISKYQSSSPTAKKFNQAGANRAQVPPKDPQQTRNEATSDAQAAVELVTQADSLLKSAPTRDKVKLAMDLFIRAGQLAEKAGKAFQGIAPQNATEQEVRSSFEFAQKCLTNVQELKKILETTQGAPVKRR